jgi:group I intron endonuclease
MGLIYLITCLITLKVYVGQTTLTLNVRWNCHKSGSKNPDKGCTKLYRAMNKHNVENFTIEVLEEADNDLLDELEKQYIAEFDSVSKGYNLKSGGDRSNHSDETKALLKVINAENMQTTFKQFRKHNDVLNDLPIHCIYINKNKTGGVAINKHPLCGRKNFTVQKYGSMENAKYALKEFLKELETSGIAKLKMIKKDVDLPKGIRRIRNSYFVYKTIKGTIYQASFSGNSDDENKNNAIEYLKSIN